MRSSNVQNFWQWLRWLRGYGHDSPVATLQVRISRVGFLSFCVFFVILFVFFQGFFSQHFVVRVRITVWARIRKTKRKRKDNIFCLESELDQCLVTKPRSDPKKIFCFTPYLGDKTGRVYFQLEI
jgi:hypothetical protein